MLGNRASDEVGKSYRGLKSQKESWKGAKRALRKPRRRKRDQHPSLFPLLWINRSAKPWLKAIKSAMIGSSSWERKIGG
jgi:hypothetical protein